jgi:hypothetical protein
MNVKMNSKTPVITLMTSQMKMAAILLADVVLKVSATTGFTTTA